MPCPHKEAQIKILKAGESYFLGDKKIIVSEEDAPLKIITFICGLTKNVISDKSNKCNVRIGYKDCKGQQ